MDVSSTRMRSMGVKYLRLTARVPNYGPIGYLHSTLASTPRSGNIHAAEKLLSVLHPMAVAGETLHTKSCVLCGKAAASTTTATTTAAAATAEPTTARRRC